MNKMVFRKIVKLPASGFRRKAHTVTKFDKNLQTLIDDMIETMRAAPGVGLAAPQVSISERLIVVEYGEEEEDESEGQQEGPKKLFVMINPEIVRSSPAPMKVKAEGWLARSSQSTGRCSRPPRRSSSASP